MKITDQNTEPTDYRKYLPHYAALKNNETAKWVCFGTLTHKYSTAPATQISRFKTLMDTLGASNNSFGKRLHWVVRAEQHASEKWHLHFLLGAHKVIDGRTHRYSIKDACAFLENKWEYGIADVEAYDAKRNGLEYVLKKTGKDYDDLVEMSTSLTTLLKKDKTNSAATQPNVRDPLLAEVIAHLNRDKVVAYFGDEMEIARSRRA